MQLPTYERERELLDTIGALEAEREKQDAHIGALREVVRAVEWEGSDINHLDACPRCFRARMHGEHGDDCELSAVLSDPQPRAEAIRALVEAAVKDDEAHDAWGAGPPEDTDDDSYLEWSKMVESNAQRAQQNLTDATTAYRALVASPAASVTGREGGGA